MKILCTFVLTFCICMQILPGYVRAAELPHPAETTPVVDIEIPITDLYVGDAVYISISLEKPLPLYALETVFTYDTSALRFQEIQAADIFSSQNRKICPEPKDGQGYFLITNTGEPNGQASRSLFTMTFTAKKTGTATVSFQNLTLVYQDLSYNRLDNRILANITIKRKTGQDASSGGGGGGREPSGNSGGTIHVDIPSTSVTAPIPTNSPVIPDAETEAFSDIADFSWASDAILDLNARGILSGYEDKTFRPQNFVTRAELTKIIALAVQLPDTEEQTPIFSDIKEDMWYTSYIYRASENGLVTGYEDHTFRPEDTITREEFAAVLARAAAYQERSLPVKRSNVRFADEEKISSYAAVYLDSLYMAEIINGDDTGAYRPQDPLTRAEASVGIWKYLHVTEKTEEAEPQ